MAKLARLLLYARPYGGAFLALSAGSLLMSLAGVLQPWPVKLLVDSVLGATPLPAALQWLFDAAGVAPSPKAVLVFVVAAGLVLFLLASGLDALTNWGWTVVGRRMAYALAEDLFAKLQRRSLAYHSRVGVGETITRVSGDCWSVYKLFNALVFQPVHALFAVALMLAFMVQINLMLTLVALAAAPVIIAGSLIAGRRMRDVAETQRSLEGRMRAHVQQILTGITVVQAFNREEHEELRFRSYADESIRAQQRSTLIGGLNTLASGLALTLGNALVLWAAAHQVLAGQLTIGEMLVFIAYLASLQAQMKQFAAVYPALQTLNASIERLDEVLQAEPEVADRPGAVALPEIRGQVRFEDVRFGYERERPILRGVSLEVEPGQTVALVGATGAGKSTLVSLIPRFLDPTGGRVLIDGHDVRDVQLASLRRQVALVLQEPFLFPLTIAENIAYGRPDASRSEVEAAARAANAHVFIARLPEGYDTVIGERGATLSGGERQRLSIARAVLKDAPLLILDEPTSALDAMTEALIMDALRRLARGRTTFIIAHRLATIRHADRIVVLQDGAIVESGTHRELMEAGRVYAGYAAAPPTSAVEPVAG